MKKIGHAITKFFSTIWGWIKNTAWVQPLLIVGLIFAVIFSIRPIADGIGSLLAQSSAPNFYRQKLLSDSDTEQFLKDIDNKQNRGKNGDGNFVVFYIQILEETCEHCEELESSFAQFLNRNSDIVCYAIDTSYFDDDYDYVLTEQQKDVLLEEMFNFVADGKGDTNKLMFTDEEIEKQQLDGDFFESFQTPTLVRYENYEMVDIMFGANISSTTSDVTSDTSTSKIFETFFNI